MFVIVQDINGIQRTWFYQFEEDAITASEDLWDSFSSGEKEKTENFYILETDNEEEYFDGTLNYVIKSKNQPPITIVFERGVTLTDDFLLSDDGELVWYMRSTTKGYENIFETSTCGDRDCAYKECKIKVIDFCREALYGSECLIFE